MAPKTALPLPKVPPKLPHQEPVEIEPAISLLFEPGNLVEVRIPKARTASDVSAWPDDRPTGGDQSNARL